MGEEKRKEEQEVKKPDICADRPGMATPPALVLPQYFQLESGFSFEKLMTDISLQESSQYPNILIRYGISKIAELRLQTDFTNVRTDNQNITGFDPLGIGTKIFICKGSGYLPATSILFNLTLPKTGDKRLMSNHAAPSVYLLMQHDLSDRFNICYNLGLEYDGEKAVPTDFTALCFGYNLNEKFSVFAENYNWFANNSAPDYYVDLGGAYLITNNLQADFSANFHLINVRNYFMLNTGISWRM